MKDKLRFIWSRIRNILNFRLVVMIFTIIGICIVYVLKFIDVISVVELLIYDALLLCIQLIIQQIFDRRSV